MNTFGLNNHDYCNENDPEIELNNEEENLAELDFDTLLITEIQDNPSTYREKATSVAATNAWQKVSVALDTEIKDCQNRWVRLKQYYSRERIKRDEGKTNNFKNYEKMSFIDSFIKRKKNSTFQKNKKPKLANLSKNKQILLNQSVTARTSSSSVDFESDLNSSHTSSSHTDSSFSAEYEPTNQAIDNVPDPDCEVVIDDSTFNYEYTEQQNPETQQLEEDPETQQLEEELETLRLQQQQQQQSKAESRSSKAFNASLADQGVVLGGRKSVDLTGENNAVPGDKIDLTAAGNTSHSNDQDDEDRAENQDVADAVFKRLRKINDLKKKKELMKNITDILYDKKKKS